MDDDGVGPDPVSAAELPRPPGGRGANAEVTAQEFQAVCGETLAQVLDVDSWVVGEDLSEVYGRLADEIRRALVVEDRVRARIREALFPRITAYPGAPPGAGVYQTDPATIERVHRGLLFNAGVEACDGTLQPYDTLPLTIFQVGVALVSYQGSQGTWSQRMYRRDLRAETGDPTDEMIALLERRHARGSLAQPSRRDQLSELLQRGIMAYAERAILLHRSTARWRLGHGNPAPYELITGSGSLELMLAATKVIRTLVEQNQRFVFVPSEPADLVLTTIGQALEPLEYAIVDTLKDQIDPAVSQGHYRWAYSTPPVWDGEPLTPEQWIGRFRDVVAPSVVRGVYRASRWAPAQVFYAHVDHAPIAALVALADSVLQAHRGFPLLIDVAHYTCRGVFGRDTLVGPASQAYAERDVPFRYLSERQSRYAT
jgi:hypothetical protein